MTQRRSFKLADDYRIEGLQVVGFQGAVDPVSTPAQRAPVIVDSEQRLSRVVDIQLGQVTVESIEPPLPTEGPLPGIATRFGPCPMMHDSVVAIVGKSERPLVYKIDIDRSGLPPRVAGFLRWFRDDHQLPNNAFYGRPHPDEGLWACCLTNPERRALWKVLHAEIYRSLREAVREDDPARMIAGAFWLSRVVIDQGDFYKVALALRLAGSQHWKFMLREGLRLKDEAAWEKGLEEAAYAFGRHRETPSQARHRSHRARDMVRQGAANQ